LERLQQTLAADGKLAELAEDHDTTIWEDAREFAWVPDGHGLVRIPIVSTRIPQLDALIASCEPTVPRRYSVGGNVAWLAWPQELPPSRLEEILGDIGRPAVALTGRWPDPMLGGQTGGVFAVRLLRVFDPHGRFRRPAEPEPT
jgi:hypothetical protein